MRLGRDGGDQQPRIYPTLSQNGLNPSKVHGADFPAVYWSLLAGVVKDGRAWLPLVKVRPPLCHVVLVVKCYRNASVVPVIWCFHSRYSHQRERHTFH